MKVKRQILVLFLTMLVEIPILSAQSKKEQKKQKAEVVGKIVTSKVYKINVGTCILPCKAPILYNRQIKKFPTEKQNVSLKHILT